MESSNDETRNCGSYKSVEGRLLDAAEELFCEKGFAGTSVRELAAAANCNVASVNYYFGGKDKLYTEVWRRYLVQVRDARIASIGSVMAQDEDKPRLEDLLRAFADTIIGPLMDERKGRRFVKLMTREMLDRRLPANMFVEEMIVPTLNVMRDALMKTCPGLEESKVPLVLFSIAGQLVHAVRMKAIFEQTGKAEMPMVDLTEAVEHIIKFSAAGIRAYAEGKA